MSRAALKRKKSRQRYLAELAQDNPQQFSLEWSKRLESWSVEAERRARRITYRNGNPVPPAFDLIEQALAELEACGLEAVALEWANTKAIMMNACCQAVASVVDQRIYRTSKQYQYRSDPFQCSNEGCNI